MVIDFPPSKTRFYAGITTAILSRIVLNTARRFAYPFAPVISRGLEVPLTAVTSLIAVNQATGLLGLVFGPLIDRWGYRRMMLAGLAVLVLGMLAAAMLPTYVTVLAALFLAGLGKTIFDPAIQAYAGTQVPFQRRGLIIGLLEFSWAGSTLLGIPVIGILIVRFGWQSPFWVLGITGLVSIIVLARLIPRDPAPSAVVPHRSTFRSIFPAWRYLVVRRAPVGALIFAFLYSFANDNLFVIYGVWLEETFGLGIVALGLGTGLIGTAELGGELCTAALSDKIGLKRAVVIGLIVSTLCYGLLPVVSTHLYTALATLFVLFLAFEFMVVSFMSLCTELVPELRATMIAMYLAAAGLGRVIGAVVGGPVWLTGGIWLIGLVSVVACLLGLAALVWGLRDWRHD